MGALAPQLRPARRSLPECGHRLGVKPPLCRGRDSKRGTRAAYRPPRPPEAAEPAEKHVRRHEP